MSEQYLYLYELSAWYRYECAVWYRYRWNTNRKTMPVTGRKFLAQEDIFFHRKNFSQKFYPGKGVVWPASFIVTKSMGLVGVRGKNKSPFLHDLASQRNCWPIYLATTLSSRIRGGVCLILRDELTGEVLSSFSYGVCELLIVHVHQMNTIVTPSSVSLLPSSSIWIRCWSFSLPPALPSLHLFLFIRTLCFC